MQCATAIAFPRPIRGTRRRESTWPTWAAGRSREIHALEFRRRGAELRSQLCELVGGEVDHDGDHGVGDELGNRGLDLDLEATLSQVPVAQTIDKQSWPLAIGCPMRSGTIGA